MHINTIPFEASSSYSAEGKMVLDEGGASITSHKIRITTDEAGAVRSFADGLPGGSGEASAKDADLWDFIKIENTETGKIWDFRLYNAAMSGSLELAEEAISDGVDVHFRIKQGATALHWAAVEGRADVAEFLLNNGAEVDAEDGMGWRPISLAAHKGFNHVVDLLQERGAKPPAVPSNQPQAATDESNALGKILQNLEQAAREGHSIISTSRTVHFDEIVPLMEAVGAERQGSQRLQAEDSKNYIVDLYTLPSGGTIKVGYEE